MDLNTTLSSTEDNGETASYKCAECGRGYSTIRDLISHQGIHTGEYPYVCEYCHKGYKCKMNLINHINLHTGEGFQCKNCQKIYSSAFLLKQHERWHVKEKRFMCKLCGKAFKVPEMLKTHTKRTHSDNLHSCHRCRIKLSSDKALQAHLKNHSLRDISCPICHRLYKSQKSLQFHLVLHESSTKKLLSCHVCGAKFRCSVRLKKHYKRLHTKPPKHECIYCGVCVESQEVLGDHIAEHKKTKPVSCQFCGGPLLRRHKHKYWAVDVKPSVCCPRCPAQFRYPAELLEHAHVHGDNPAELKLECELCGRYFLCKSKYQEHIGKPHASTSGAVIADYMCNSCCKTFKNSSDLKEHVKMHHRKLELPPPSTPYTKFISMPVLLGCI